MGSYASFKIDSYELFSMKSFVDPAIMTVFSERDKNVKIEKDEDGEKNKIIQYTTTAKIAKTRLNIMGFNTLTLEKVLELSKKDDILNFNAGDFGISTLTEFKKLLDALTISEYLMGLKKIYDNKVELLYTDYYDENPIVEKLKADDFNIKYILESLEFSDTYFDHRLYLRGLLDKLDDDTQIFIDVSNIVDAGYYEENTRIAEQCLDRNNKTIIFTEGKYDTKVIKKSMELLYPQYVDYYSFLDIESSNLELGANRVITYLKSFISAGIANRVLVLFDNDAEGEFCKQELLTINNLPNNFCINTYPNIETAEKYPTICPTGIEVLNINGSACSIEAYHCEEVLKKDNQFIPIQWSSFNEHVNKYQGSFSKKNKGLIQKKYENILKECTQNSAYIENYNFDNMKTLLRAIFTAFDNKIINF